MNRDDQPELVKVNMTLRLSRDHIEKLEQLKFEYGVSSRVRVVELLLDGLFSSDEG